ncbi:MAG: hypothetical protein OXD54_15390 [Candidatus Poribacteria bacterium]|nr:hypothetical protein [Candidatus Poribacteria bacterium]
MMIVLSEELRQAVKNSKDNFVRLVDPETNAEYVVLPAETYAQMQVIQYDDSPISEDEKKAILVELGLSIGWDDPEMDVYNELDPRRENGSITR